MFSEARQVASLGVVLCALTVEAAAPNLTGLFRAGELGLVEFVANGGQVSGRAKAGGVCGFAVDTEVITGAFEGDAFVGSVTVCQQGGTCAEKQKRYPFLGVWSADRVAGLVKLDVGCTSEALSERRLVLLPATAEDRAKATPKPVAKPGELKALYTEASDKLAVGEFTAASELFQKVIAFEDPTFTLGARIGLGVAQVSLKEYAAAVENLQQATTLATRLKEYGTASEASYNLACALAQLGRTQDAVEAIRQAVQLGKPGQYVAQLERDADLIAIRADPEFRKVVAEARLQREPRKRNK